MLQSIKSSLSEYRYGLGKLGKLNKRTAQSA